MKKEKNKQLDKLLLFLDESPTAWHATENCGRELAANGFIELKEEEKWNLKPGLSYFVKKNGTSLCAFTVPKSAPKKVYLAAAHTDSPSLKLKPNAEFTVENMTMLGLEMYGSPILASWQNRDLGIAGRIMFNDLKGELKEELVKITSCPVILPQLAIHLDRTVNENGSILHKQDHLAVFAGIKHNQEKVPFIENLLKQHISFKKLLAHDLFVFPLEKARFLGEEQGLIASYRIDNLISTYAIIHGLIERKKESKHSIKMAILWDSEEIGSNTSQGASSPFLSQIIERIALSFNLSREDYFSVINRSLCLSIDLGHALHPHFKDKHEPRHFALLNKGIIIKSNAQNRYSTDARSSAVIISLCEEHNIPFQHYLSRGDIPCGTTVGPINAHTTGMATVDLGISQLSMHSCREIVGSHDYLSLCNLLGAYFSVLD